MVLAFAGHRPEKLPWGSDESDPRCIALKRQIIEAVRTAAGEGYDTFLCGMARGCDLYFAEAVLAVKAEKPEILLEAWLPCPEQADRWAEDMRKRYRELLLRCDRVFLLQPEYSEGCMLRRNRAMVERADRLISVWDGTRGGTGATVRYARELGVDIEALWL